MRTHKSAGRPALYAFAALLAGTALAPAFDTAAPGVPVATPVPLARAKSPDEMRTALAAYRAGDKASAAGILTAAAARGHVPAQWKLARMLAAGDGIAPDTSRAAAFYREIADRYLDRDPPLALVPFVADATREAGRLALANRHDVRGARRHLYRAATDYRDAQARHLLGLSLLDETHGRPQPERAARWLRAAAELGHAHAGAKLGEMQVFGEGIAAAPVDGLVTMARAVERAAHSDRATLALRFQSARMRVDATARAGADAVMARLGLEAAMQPIMQAVAE